MTGTSVDGIDAALCEMSYVHGSLATRCLGRGSEPLGSLRKVLLQMARGKPFRPSDFLRAARRLGVLHAEVAERLCAKSLPSTAHLDLLVAHGQTVCHLPDAGRTAGEGGLSWQLFDPWPCVRQLRVPVLYDLRQADLIAGGQGAPITPVADAALFAGRCDVVINLGGICNVSDIREMPTGRDVGPCNLLIDQVVQLLYPGMEYDDAGAIAAQGVPHSDIFASLRASAPVPVDRPVSLGREDFSSDRIEPLVAQTRLGAPDVVASAVAFVAEMIGRYVADAGARRILLAGGGVRNRTLVHAIQVACPDHCAVMTSEALGIEPQAREAVCMAVLGALTAVGEPITNASITGALSPGSAGAWAYP